MNQTNLMTQLYTYPARTVNCLLYVASFALPRNVGPKDGSLELMFKRHRSGFKEPGFKYLAFIRQSIHKHFINGYTGKQYKFVHAIHKRKNKNKKNRVIYILGPVCLIREHTRHTVRSTSQCSVWCTKIKTLNCKLPYGENRNPHGAVSAALED